MKERIPSHLKSITGLGSYIYEKVKLVEREISEMYTRVGRNKMTKTKILHAIFDGEVLKPEETVDLEPNVRYLVTIERKEAITEQNLWDVLSDFTGTVEGPEDWSEEHDHYLYGVPRRGKGCR